MAQFTVRIELHGASDSHYTLLHSLMANMGFQRFIEGKDAAGLPGKWQLPSGEYNGMADETATELRARIKTLADGVKPGAWVSVTGVASRSWSTIKLKA
jgi:hypothetical protein